MVTVLATGTAADGVAFAEVYTVRVWNKWFDAAEGYGFIRSDNELPDLLRHVQCLRTTRFQKAHEAAIVSAEIVLRPKGLQAVRIFGMGPEPLGPACATNSSGEGWHERSRCEAKSAMLPPSRDWVRVNDAGNMLLKTQSTPARAACFWKAERSQSGGFTSPSISVIMYLMGIIKLFWERPNRCRRILCLRSIYQCVKQLGIVTYVPVILRRHKSFSVGVSNRLDGLPVLGYV